MENRNGRKEAYDILYDMKAPNNEMLFDVEFLKETFGNSDIKFKKIGDFPEADEIGLFNTTAEFIQESYKSNDMEELHIRTEDTGGGVFYVIETKSWAFNKISDLTAVIEKFTKMVDNIQ